MQYQHGCIALWRSKPSYKRYLQISARSPMRTCRILPSESYFVLQVPSILHLSISEGEHTASENRLLAQVRLNRLLDLFLHAIVYSERDFTHYSDKLYLCDLCFAINDRGQKCVIPHISCTHNGDVSLSQVKRTLRLCRRQFPPLRFAPSPFNPS
jgi:hypothetical protein